VDTTAPFEPYLIKQDAAGIVFVYSIIDADSFAILGELVKIFLKSAERRENPLPLCFLVGTKLDKLSEDTPRAVSLEACKELATSMNASHVELSSCTGTNIGVLKAVFSAALSQVFFF